MARVLPLEGMIDASFLDQGYSADPAEPLYAEFHRNGSLKLFRSGPGGAAGKTIVLSLDPRGASGRLETMDVALEPSEDSDGEDFASWVRSAIQRVYERNQGIVRCAFCEKSAAEVATLIAGPTSYICNDCISVCAKILAEQ
ncbi:MAG: ClpX C4-type zinc finger protein [Bryobacteraceae bacterium]